MSDECENAGFYHGPCPKCQYTAPSKSTERIGSSELLGDVGQPNESPMSGNVIWEHPRVQAASKELHAAAEAYGVELAKFHKDTNFDSWSRACCRLENAAIAFGNTVHEYRVA